MVLVIMKTQDDNDGVVDTEDALILTTTDDDGCSYVNDFYPLISLGGLTDTDSDGMMDYP